MCKLTPIWISLRGLEIYAQIVETPDLMAMTSVEDRYLDTLCVSSVKFPCEEVRQLEDWRCYARLSNCMKGTILVMVGDKYTIYAGYSMRRTD